MVKIRLVCVYLGVLLIGACSDDTPENTGEVKQATLPAGVIEGINIINDNTATFVLYDKAKITIIMIRLIL